ncbi:MarR family winged helix-turn-helix transcriptional regulator [Metabacillus sp. RGM 3146]|uniref:MarR family winged helix-turn-helix transcriptional regulator n=1 Tax=Metabacillus sp. RGM 3146 TaxID=3401092 RepID=UPI003B9D29AE
MIQDEMEFMENLQMVISSIRKKLKPVIQQKMAPYGITLPQFNIMMALHKEGATRVTQVADFMNVKPSAITVIMDRLIERNVVKRYQSKEDRRVVMMELTSEGCRLLKEMKITYKEVMSKYIAHFTLAEMTYMLEMFEKFDEIISEENTAE